MFENSPEGGAAQDEHDQHVRDYKLMCPIFCISVLAAHLASQPAPKRSDVVKLVIALGQSGREVIFDEFLERFEPQPSNRLPHARPELSRQRRSINPGSGLNELCEYPLLNEENEKLICIACEIAQVRYRRELFSNIAMVEAAVARIERISIKDRSPGKLQYTDVFVRYKRGERAADQLKPVIPDKVKTLRGLIQEYRQESSKEPKQEILDRIFLILEQMPIKTEKFAKELCQKMSAEAREHSGEHDRTQAESASILKYGMNSDEISSYLTRLDARERDLVKVLDVLCQANMRLVINIAVKLVRGGTELSDLVNDGYISLRLAACRFDYTQGNRFTTFAKPYVLGLLRQCLSYQGQMIDVPAEQRKEWRRKSEKYYALMQTLGRTPNSEEKDPSTPGSRGHSTLINARAINAAMLPPASLDDPIFDGVERQKDRIPGEDGRNAINSFLDRESIGPIIKSILTPRQWQVIDLYYGLTHGTPHSFKEIANFIGGTHKNAEKLQKNALRKLAEELTPPTKDQS